MALAKPASLLEDTLRIKYVAGGVSHVACPYTTTWRSMPYAMVAHWSGATVRYERAGERPVHVPPGSALLAPADSSHCVTLDGTNPATCRWAHMEMTICGGIDILRFLQAPAVVDGHAAKALGDLCEALAENAEAPRLPPLTLIARSRSLEYQLLDTLLTLVHWSGSQVETVESIAHVLPVLVAIQDNLAGDIRRDDLAALIGLSPAHFHAVFKAATGIPPMEYVIRLRIREAQSLLLQTTATVAEVAERSGFHDPFHFSRLFRSRCGVSPAQYRRETRSLPVGGG